MTQRPVFLIGVTVLMITLLVLIVGLYSMTNNISSRTRDFSTTIKILQDSVASLQAAVTMLKDQVPGLGEYMSTFQLHMGELWFATEAANWDLAQYELGELTETMEAAEALHAVKNNINTASVIQSVRGTQLKMLEKSLQDRNKTSFAGAYDQTIETCNSCHQAVGYRFIHIIKPLLPPVTNQSWKIVQ